MGDETIRWWYKHNFPKFKAACLKCLSDRHSDEYKSELLFGSFKPDTRAEELKQELLNYYKKTENMSNAQSLACKREFRSWCETRGFTKEEVSDAKRSVSG